MVLFPGGLICEPLLYISDSLFVISTEAWRMQ